MCWDAKMDMELLAEFTASHSPTINMEPLTGFSASGCHDRRAGLTTEVLHEI